MCNIQMPKGKPKEVIEKTMVEISEIMIRNFDAKPRQVRVCLLYTSGVHPVKHLCPVLGLSPAGAGMNGQDHVGAVVLAGEQRLQTGRLHIGLQMGEAILELRDLSLIHISTLLWGRACRWTDRSSRARRRRSFRADRGRDRPSSTLAVTF